MQLKTLDFKLQKEESDNRYTKGEFTSFGQVNTEDDLLLNFGVKVKLQNGSKMEGKDIEMIRQGLLSFFETFKDISNQLREHDILISYSKMKRMHASRASGVFSPYYKAIGVSDMKDVNRVLAHELGHFMDYILGVRVKRFYASDDRNSLAGKIADTFRRKMRRWQASEYKNRTKECFARAIEQYYCSINKIEIGEMETEYCRSNEFDIHISPLIRECIKII